MVFEFRDIVLHRVGQQIEALFQQLQAGGAGDGLRHGGQLADGLNSPEPLAEISQGRHGIPP